MEKEAERGHAIGSEFPRLIFLGTPDFAVPSLQKLAASGAEIKLVITQPDRPKGRGKKLSPPPVKVSAQRLHLATYQPERIKSQEAIDRVRSCSAECAVLVAYGQLLAKEFLDLFPLGVLNVHASLLPRHRGAAPIQRAILSGAAKTGVTIMLLDAGLDTGPILSQQEVEILDDDTSGTLHDKLARTGADLLCETLNAWKAGRIQPRQQDETLASYAPPIAKEELRLMWHHPARQLVNAVRAFDPWPGAYALYAGVRLKCFDASLPDWEVEGEPGEVVGQTEKGLVVLAGDGQALVLGSLQMAGQRRLSAREFLRGHPLPAGTLLQ